MVKILRGEIWWALLPNPRGSEPGFRRPVVIVQANSFNRSAIRTVLALALTSNLTLADAPGNVLLSADVTGLPKDSVANVSQLLNLDKRHLLEKVSQLSLHEMGLIDEGLRKILDLES